MSKQLRPMSCSLLNAILNMTVLVTTARETSPCLTGLLEREENILYHPYRYYYVVCPSSFISAIPAGRRFKIREVIKRAFYHEHLHGHRGRDRKGITALKDKGQRVGSGEMSGSIYLGTKKQANEKFTIKCEIQCHTVMTHEHKV